ncbi:hypothetical protein [Spartinivicinus ruber]|uniref:hypothetical protein n=1 Tax=Spartinivicinus ruber TaxID=2683272 RepID=UPI0013D4D0DD|nr:hypothetical protein [Spartinivicinus ruber]
MNKAVISVLCSILLLSGCEQTDEAVINPATQAAIEEAQQAAKEAAKPKPPEFKFAKEDINDPSIYKTPRIQFLWKPPTSKKAIREVWSSDLTGGDLRQVASNNELGGGEQGQIGPFGATISRSPNNRYLAYTWLVPAKSRYYRCIWDLKKRKRVVIEDGVGIPSFNWSQDSRFLHYLNAQTVKRYDLKTSEIKEHSHKFGSPFYLFDSGKKVFSASGKEFMISDFESGEVVKKWQWSEKINHDEVYVNTNQSRYIYTTYGDYYKRGVFSFSEPKSSLYTYSAQKKSFIGPDNKLYLLSYQAEGGSSEKSSFYLQSIDLKTKKITRLKNFPRGGSLFKSFSVYNKSFR